MTSIRFRTVLVLAVCLMGLGLVGPAWAEETTVPADATDQMSLETSDTCLAQSLAPAEPDLLSSGGDAGLGGFCDDCQGGCSIWCISDDDCNRQCPFGFGSCGGSNRCLCACL